MNNDRRKRLDNVRDDVAAFEKSLSALYLEANDLIGKANEVIGLINADRSELRDSVTPAIEEVKDEEQEAYDNMPEDFQNGEKGELMQEAINAMGEALNALEMLDDIDELEEFEMPDLSADIADPLENAASG